MNTNKRVALCLGKHIVEPSGGRGEQSKSTVSVPPRLGTRLRFKFACVDKLFVCLIGLFRDATHNMMMGVNKITYYMKSQLVKHNSYYEMSHSYNYISVCS